MVLYVKNMVCNRCITAVSNVFRQVGLEPERVALGEVELNHDELEASTLKQIDQELILLGFQRIDDRKGRLVEAIKNKVIALVHEQTEWNRKLTWSAILAEELHHDYNYLSSLFSSVEGITVEQYIIQQKIERVKELLLYDELTLSQIAIRLGYSSVAHLSAQFKKVTGLTPSALKKERQARKPLDMI